jgi:hypothetical protein
MTAIGERQNTQIFMMNQKEIDVIQSRFPEIYD